MTNALPAPMCPESSEGAAPRYTGAILGLLDDVLQGWAADTSTPDGAPVIEVFIDGASVALARADQYEPNADAPHQFCGFTVQLRRDWLDSASAISVGIANTTVMLPGTVKLPTLTTEAAAVASQLWHTGGLRVAGWSWDPQDPTRHVTLRVKEGDEVVCEVVCNEPHQALAYRDTCDHGFTIDLPWALADGAKHLLTVEDDQGRPITGSPIRLCCLPEGMEGAIGMLGAEHDSATVALLKVLAQEASLRLPKSAGWQHYAKWYEAFQRVDTNNRPRLIEKVGLLILTDANTTEHEQEITLSSVKGVSTELLEFSTAARMDVSPALSRLMEIGCASVLPIQAGDRLAPEALYHLGTLLSDGCEWGFGDCDQDGPNGERTNPWFKPIWDIDYFIGADIFTPGAIFGAALINEILAEKKRDDSGDSIGWEELTARIALATEKQDKRVSHLPRVMYHRRHSEYTLVEQQDYSEARYRAMSWLCDRLIPGAQVETLELHGGLFKVKWPLPLKLPKVSLIVPTRDQHDLLKACIEGLLTGTDYPNLEVIVMDNQSSDPQTLAYLDQIKGRDVIVIPHPFPFNYSTINNEAVKYATGEIIGLINNDIEIIHPGWLDMMVAQVTRPGVGAVGAKLLWPNRMVQHAGVVTGINGLAAHAGNRLQNEDTGYMGNNSLVRQQEAVTAACLITSKKLFLELDGLDSYSFPVAFNDVDFCKRVRQSGLRIIIETNATLIHRESASRGKDIVSEKLSRANREQEIFRTKWFSTGELDPYYHPALCHDYIAGPYGGLALPPRSMHHRESR